MLTPVCGEYVPGGHGVGTPMPTVGQYVPIGHGTGSVEPMGIVIVPCGVMVPCGIAALYSLRPLVGIEYVDIDLGDGQYVSIPHVLLHPPISPGVLLHVPA